MDCEARPFKKLLDSGAVRLLRGSAILRWAEEGKAIVKRQDVAEEDFADPNELRWDLTPEAFGHGLQASSDPVQDCDNVRLVALSASTPIRTSTTLPAWPRSSRRHSTTTRMLLLLSSGTLHHWSSAAPWMTFQQP